MGRTAIPAERETLQARGLSFFGRPFPRQGHRGDTNPRFLQEIRFLVACGVTTGDTVDRLRQIISPW